MLVLQRKSGESILIGENIRIVVLRMEGKIVKIGIDAPQSINIVREEIVENWRNRVQSDQTSAAVL